MSKRNGTTKSVGSSSASASRTTNISLTSGGKQASFKSLGKNETKSFDFQNGVRAEVSEYKMNGNGPYNLDSIRIEAWVPPTGSTPINNLGFFTFPYSSDASERETLRIFTRQEAIKEAEKQLRELQKRNFK